MAQWGTARLNGKARVCTPVNQRYVLPIERTVRVGGTRAVIGVPWHHLARLPSVQMMRLDL